MTRGTEAPLDVFISYTQADVRWATWIAWQLEAAGYTTMIQAWDFVPGTPFMDFMDRGLRTSRVVLAVLSRSYLVAPYGQMEWQAALRSSPQKLVPVRVDDCSLEGLLASVTWVDLAEVRTENDARARLLSRLGHAFEGRAKPAAEPLFPAGDGPAGNGATAAVRGPRWRTPAAAPAYPPSAVDDGAREAISVLHLAGPRFGLDAGSNADELQRRVYAGVAMLTGLGAPQPDLVVVAGDVTAAGRRSEIVEGRLFLARLRDLLGLEAHRLMLVPGGHDVSRAACRAYFATCEAEDQQPQRPYYPKLAHYADLFASLYEGIDGPVFDAPQPWTLFELRDLRVAVAGLNSTMAISDRTEDDHGLLGEPQLPWFADRLRHHEDAGWLRLGVVCHDPLSAASDGRADRLEDAGSFERLVGRRLNLLFSGRRPGGAAIAHLGADLPVLAPPAGGQPEIVEVTADGLRRWRTDADGPELAPHRWHACGATFSRPSPAAAPREPAEVRPVLDPVGLLLARIEEVCTARDGQVRVRRIEGADQLLVTSSVRGAIEQRRIGAIVGRPTRTALDAFLASDPGRDAELVYQAPSAPPGLREEARLRGVTLRSFTEFQGLLDLSDYVTRQTARLRADRVYAPDLYVPQRFRELGRGDQQVHDDVAAELMRLITADAGSFALVLGDFGRGKTFLLREVARRVADQVPHVIPILIDLRALDKAHTVEGLVAAHLANHGETRIDLDALQYMLRHGRVVLLFDGFDELVTRVTYDRATEHLDTLLRAADGSAKIILSSRTQHFRSNTQVLMALGERVDLLQQRRMLVVEDFTTDQIQAYLQHRYGSSDEADRRLDLIGGVRNLLELSRNPRMLSFISELEERRLRAVAVTDSPVSPARLYEEILTSWLQHEAQRAHGEPGTAAGLDVDALWRAVTILAGRLWLAGEPFLQLEDLSEVAATLTTLAEVPLTPEQTAHAMGAGSLLVRTDEGAFGFIHDSVMEWLVAKDIAGQLTADPPQHPPQLGQRPLSQLTVDLLCDLAGVDACQAWVRRQQSTAGMGEIARTNAVRIAGRLRTAPTADLRGASLHGEDLSGRDFQGVDFTGADLSGTQLARTNLAGAVLRSARLVGARLERAVLHGADLSSADLTRARLANADLRGAQLEGSRWNLAALINVTGVPDAPELRGAAVAPGQEVVTVFAPAEISVRHGFHPGLGRLPEALSYSHDGGTLAIGSEDGGVLVCETATGRPVRNLQGHRGRVIAASYGPDDRLLVTGASDGDVRLWDAATGRSLHVLRGHRDWAWPVVVSPRGEWVVSGDSTGLLRLWDTATGERLLEMPHEHGIVYTAAFHPDGNLLAAGYQDGTVRLWSTATGESLAALRGETGSVFRVAFNPSGTMLGVAEAEGTLRLWDPHRGVVLRDLAGHRGSVYTIAFHPREPILASGDTAGAVRLWNTSSGACLAVLQGHEQPIYWVVFSPGGDVLASGDGAGAVRLWDTGTGSVRHALTGHSGSVWPFAFRPDGRQLAISDDQFTVRLWDPDRGVTQHALAGHGRQVTSVSFSADGATLATSSNDGIVRLWNPRTGRMLDTVIGTEDRLVTLQSAAFDPRGRLLATVSNDGRVNLRNVETGKYERHLNVETPPVWALAFSPDGDSIATANDDDTVRLWWRHNGRLMHTLSEHEGRVRSIAFHPLEQVLATGCGDQKVRLWSTENGELLRTLTGHTDRVYAVSYSADGTLLASASWDGSIRVWTAAGELLHVLRGHTGRLYAAAFAPDGFLLASAGDDLVIRLWDGVGGERLHTLIGHSRRVWSLSFAPDGSALASAGDDGTARLWSLGADPRLKLTLLGWQGGWAATTLDGRYKHSGDAGGQFWHAIGMCRFEPGELDVYLPEVRHLPDDTEF